jgi:hypothetical protein
VFVLVALAVAGCGSRRDRSMLKKLTPVHTSRSYGQLFVNLAVANCLSCVLSWLSNNTLLLFQDQLLSLLITNQCLFFVFLVSSIFVSTSFVIVSTLTMLGFSVVQYSAICRRPVLSRHPGDLSYRRSRVPVYIAVIWTLSLIAGVSPFALLLPVTRQQSDCEPRRIRRIMIYGVDACAALVVAVYATIFVLCYLIYQHIRSVRAEINRFNVGDGWKNGADVIVVPLPVHQGADIRRERRAFGTIGLLLGTLGAFFGPYMTLHLLSLNVPAVEARMNGPGAAPFIYYMNLLPYLKHATDPIIYGLRMRDVRYGCRLMFGCAAARRTASSARRLASGRRDVSNCAIEVMSVSTTPAGPDNLLQYA